MFRNFEDVVGKLLSPGSGLRGLAGQGFSPDYLLSPNPLHHLWRERLGDSFPVSDGRDIIAVGYADLATLGLCLASRSQTRPLAVMGMICFVLRFRPALR